jgi:Ran-binding protein 1
MRRDKTLKVCANHVSEYSHNHPPCRPGSLDCYIVSTDMRLQPNIGSDRSWVWKVAADYSEQPPTSETLAIRFANSESESV